MSNFFQDHTGKFSIMRLKTLLLVLAGIFIAVFQVVSHSPIDHFIVMEFVAIGLGFKIWQNQQETQKQKS